MPVNMSPFSRELVSQLRDGTLTDAERAKLESLVGGSNVQEREEMTRGVIDLLAQHVDVVERASEPTKANVKTLLGNLASASPGAVNWAKAPQLPGGGVDYLTFMRSRADELSASPTKATAAHLAAVTNDRRAVVSKTDADAIIKAALEDIATASDPQATLFNNRKIVNAALSTKGLSKSAKAVLSTYETLGAAAVEARLKVLFPPLDVDFKLTVILKNKKNGPLGVSIGNTWVSLMPYASQAFTLSLRDLHRMSNEGVSGLRTIQSMIAGRDVANMIPSIADDAKPQGYDKLREVVCTIFGGQDDWAAEHSDFKNKTPVAVLTAKGYPDVVAALTQP